MDTFQTGEKQLNVSKGLSDEADGGKVGIKSVGVWRPLDATKHAQRDISIN